MAFGIISEPAIPKGRPERARDPKNNECGTPSQAGYHPRHNRQGERGPEPRAGKHEALHEAACRHGNPDMNGPGASGERPRFAGSKKKAATDKREETLHGRSQ